MREQEATAPLIARVLVGDVAARDTLFEVWGPVVLRWCARLGGPRVDEEDAAHDVFEIVFTRLHALREPKAFAKWLFATTRGVVRDHRRRAWIRRWVPGLVADVADASADERVERDDLARAVRDAIDSLPTDLREVLVLVEMEQRNGPEVAELTGVPLGTIKSRLRRGRARFEMEARRRGLMPDMLADGAGEECG